MQVLHVVGIWQPAVQLYVAFTEHAVMHALCFRAAQNSHLMMS